MVAAALCALAMAAGPLAAGSPGAARDDEKNKETMTSDAGPGRPEWSRITSRAVARGRTEQNGNRNLDEDNMKVEIDAKVTVIPGDGHGASRRRYETTVFPASTPPPGPRSLVSRPDHGGARSPRV
jgi:hypothetical protein